MPREDIEKLTQFIAQTPDPATLTVKYARDFARREGLKVSDSQIENLLKASRGELSEADLGEVVGGVGVRVPAWYLDSSVLQKDLDREF